MVLNWRSQGGKIFKNNAFARRSACTLGAAVFNKPPEAAFKRSQFLQLPAHLHETHLSNITGRRAVTAWRSRNRHQFSNLLNRIQKRGIGE